MFREYNLKQNFDKLGSVEFQHDFAAKLLAILHYLNDNIEEQNKILREIRDKK